jgi:uncharacterized protein
MSPAPLNQASPPTAEPPAAFDTYELVLLRLSETAPALDDDAAAQLQRQHLGHFAAMRAAGHLKVAGPLSDQPDESWRGICLYQVGSLQEARRLAELDPAVKAGRFRVEVMTWRTARGALRFPGQSTSLVAVRGEAVLEVDPEIAYLWVTVSSRDTDRGRALQHLNDRAVAVDAVLARFSDTVERVETERVTVSPQLRDSARTKERVSGYVATVRRSVTVAKFDRLGELVAQLADQDMTQLTGPEWALRPDSTAHRSARVEAARDAVRQARDYAQALGTELIELVELADSGLLADAGRRRGAVLAHAAAAFRGGAPAPDELTFDLTPAKQTVQASVEARFTVAGPDLGAVGPV